MNPNLGLPVRPLRKPAEASPWVPPSDSTSPYQNWRHSAGNIDQSQDLTNIMGGVNRAFAKIPSTYAFSYGFHPFKIYQLPAEIRESMGGGFSPDDWRKVRVRTGNVYYNSFGQVSDSPGQDKTYICPTGTDMSNDFRSGFDFYQLPNGDTFTTSGVFPTFDLTADFDVPLVAYGSKVWFWVSITEALDSFPTPLDAEIVMSEDPTSAGWDNFPEPNPYIIPIGWVDFTTYWLTQAYENAGFDYNTSFTPDIRQLVSTDIVLNCPRQMTFYGTWGAGAFDGNGYPEGAVVDAESSNVAGKTNSYVSLEWFNTDDPTTGAASWTCLGQRPITNP